MQRIFITLLMAGLLITAGRARAGASPYYRDLFPDTWVGHDALGRNLPTASLVGPVKKDHLKWDSSQIRQPGRPQTRAEIAGLILPLVRENRSWG